MAFEDNLMTFIDHYKSTLEAKQNGENSVHKEFATLKSQANKLKQEKQYAATAGEKSCNLKKNRYKDILPLAENKGGKPDIASKRVQLPGGAMTPKGHKTEDDKTRFVLKPTESNPDGSDYINANYIEGTKEAHAYIAAQGPLPSTVNDFWRLLWECGGSIIIMACNEYEMGKNKAKQHKCERYWAEKDEEKTFGDITVSLVDSEISKRDFSVRQLRAKKGNEEKLYHQFHYTAWPDHGVPDTVTSILELVRQARDLQPKENKPFIVHCSAGCGRTGTIIALDYVAELVKSQKISGDFSLFNIIFNMRKQRPAIVQTKEQYEFVHKAVSELFKHELSNLGVDYGHNYENVQIGVPVTVDKPRKPPTLPNAQGRSKPGETLSPPKPASRATAPPGEPDPTVYANADDLKKRPTSSPAVVSVIPRERSGRDIKTMDDVQKSVSDKSNENHSVTSTRPQKLPGLGRSNQNDGRRVSGGNTAKDIKKNLQVNSQEGGKQTAHSLSGSGKPPTLLSGGGPKPSSPVSTGNAKPLVGAGRGMSPSVANRIGQLNPSHIGPNPTSGGKVSPAINRPKQQPPKPPSNASRVSPEGAAVANPDIGRKANNNVKTTKGNQSSEEDTSARAVRKPQTPLKPPPSPGGTRPPKPLKPSAMDSGGWMQNVAYGKTATAHSTSSGSISQTNVAYECVGSSFPANTSEYEPVKPEMPLDNSKSKPTASNFSTYEAVDSIKPPPPRLPGLPSSRDYTEPTGNSHNGALRPPSHNRSSIASIQSNASTGSREDSPSRDSRNYEQDVVAPVVPIRTAASYQLMEEDDDHSCGQNHQEEKSDNPLATMRRFLRIRPKIQTTDDHEENSCPQGNQAVVQPLGSSNHHAGVPVYPNRGPKPTGSRPLPTSGRGNLKILSS